MASPGDDVPANPTETEPETETGTKSEQPRATALLGGSICLAKPEAGKVLHKGDQGFDEFLGELFTSHEAKALAQLSTLKATLRCAVHADDFWRLALGGISEIIQTQMLWITRRITTDTDEPNGKASELGEPGANLHCLAWHYQDDNGNSGFGRHLRSESHTSPSAYMRFNKVFLLPAGLRQFVPDYVYMNKFPFHCESYLGLPLFSDGECIGHLGCSYTPNGLANKTLSWGTIQMILHTFEDMFADRLLAETETSATLSTPSAVCAPAAETTSASLLPSQGFKPYAQSLSHEIRTPMQGVVGMLDVMHTSLIEATESESPKAELILKRLQEDIEATQDSCRRAVEAADNVVQAYDLNMGLPMPGPSSACGDFAEGRYPAERVRKDPTKSRKRSHDLELLRRKPKPVLQPFKYSLSDYSERQEGLQRAVQESEDLTAAHGMVSTRGREEAQQAWQEKSRTPSPPRESGVHEVHLPDLLEWVIGESLKIGGRPKASEAYDIENGQVIEAAFMQNSGVLVNKVIQWRVEPSVPDYIHIHERSLAKIISCVFQNALKFTREGHICVLARDIDGELNILVSDSGPGISPAFQAHLFEPFAREDFSTTRGNEGLGLGLLVAKSLSHRLGGDLVLVRSEKAGAMRGSDFEIRVPFVPKEMSSGSSSRRTSSTAGLHGAQDAALAANKRRASAVGLPEPLAKSRRLSADHANAASCRDLMSSPRLNPLTPSSPHARGRSSTLAAVAEDAESAAAEQGVVAKDKYLMDAPRRLTPPPDDVRTLNRKLADDYPLRILVVEDQPINRKLLVKMLTKLGYDPHTQIIEAYDGADALRRVVGTRRSSVSSLNVVKDEFGPIDLILMDLWMPIMDGYEATQRILSLYREPLRPGQRRSITEPSNVPAAAALAGDAPIKTATVEHVRRRSRQWDADAASTPTSEAPGDGTSQESDEPPIIMAVTADTTDGAAERALQAGMCGCMLKPFKLKELERLMVQSFQKRLDRSSARRSAAVAE